MLNLHAGNVPAINDDTDRLFESFKTSNYLTAPSDAILLQQNISAVRSANMSDTTRLDATQRLHVVGVIDAFL